MTPLNGDCAGGTDDPIACEDGPGLQPLWRRERASVTAAWQAWTLVIWIDCPEDVFVLSVEDFRVLPLAKPALTVQPDRGWVLVNKETIVFTDDVTQKLTTEVLGQKIDVEADAQSWTWNWGDKTRDLTTTEAGKPYPHQTLWHTYDQLGTVQVTLTATWKGRWRLAGHTTWHDVLGTAQTTATSDPFEIRELRSRLVAPEDD
ncbi:PKD domain-containing protein [Cellulomonas sp. HZM]|uniref:PKD domain-containing protein n=1 Tax=Cellulomonas sp. HZM TaxID=1454010 RepID=UPI00055215F8|nr:PKD domain-containing protein [Cellulomonas sp. HZM]